MAVAWVGAASVSCQNAKTGQGNNVDHPNIVVILADDFGVGDIQKYYPDNKVPTPNLDRLTEQGLNFTDAHSGSAVCTPTRYGLLTGRYAWRSRLQYHVLHRYDGPLIEPEQLTLPEILQQSGYNTACVGKWHLGHEWVKKAGGEGYDYAARLNGGARDHGFDYYFGTDVPNYEPYTFIEDKHIVTLPTDTFPADELDWIPSGPIAPGYRFDQILPTLTEKACDYLEKQAEAKEPFFLYFSMTSPHEPIVPSPRFKGTTEHILFDFLRETDWSVGRVLDKIDSLGMVDNTLVIFTADNGHNHYTYWDEITALGHQPSGIYRGHKGDIWEGGHRVPFIVRWPGVTEAGDRTNQMICLNDILATLADLVGYKVPEDQAPDSFSFLSVLRGKGTSDRRTLVNHDVKGQFALRDGNWKLVLLPPDPKEGGTFTSELYDLEKDPGEATNLAGVQPDKVKAMTELLRQQIESGRSTPGPPLTNDREVKYDAIADRYLVK